MGFCEQCRKFRGQAFHFFIERLAVIFLLFNADISARSKNIILFCDLGCGGNSTEAFDIFQCSVFVSIKSFCKFLNIRIGQHTQFPGNHRSHFAGINKASLSLLLFVAAQEPQGNRDLGRIKELRRHCNDTRHEIIFNNVFADFTFAAGLGRKRTIRQHHTDLPVGSQVVDHVLKPGKVGIA